MSVPQSNPLEAGYDRSLLAATPKVSKAAKQEGYNVDLLDEPPPLRTNHTSGSGPDAIKETYNAYGSGGSAMGNGVGAGARGGVPFWRTRGGMIGLAILAIVIVGAVVGGAVGGTVGKTASHKEAPQQGVGSPSNGTNSSSVAQGEKPAPTSSTTTTTSTGPTQASQ